MFTFWKVFPFLLLNLFSIQFLAGVLSLCWNCGEFLSLSSSTLRTLLSTLAGSKVRFGSEFMRVWLFPHACSVYIMEFPHPRVWSFFSSSFSRFSHTHSVISVHIAFSQLCSRILPVIFYFIHFKFWCSNSIVFIILYYLLVHILIISRFG